MSAPLIVGIGGTTRPQSSSDRSLALALEAASRSGSVVETFGGSFLATLPMFLPERTERNQSEDVFIDAVRRADGIIIASPGYHGGVSALVKNALDLLEDLRADERPYLDGRAVGCIVTAAGWQACGSTLAALRAIAHALRGWPTPFAATINSATAIFDENGVCIDDAAAAQLSLVGQQVVEFAGRPSAARHGSTPPL